MGKTSMIGPPPTGSVWNRASAVPTTAQWPARRDRWMDLWPHVVHQIEHGWPRSGSQQQRLRRGV